MIYGCLIRFDLKGFCLNGKTSLTKSTCGEALVYGLNAVKIGTSFADKGVSTFFMECLLAAVTCKRRAELQSLAGAQIRRYT